MKLKRIRSASLGLAIMIGSLLVVEQPLLAASKQVQLIMQEDVMGSAAKMIVDEDECWVRVGLINPYSLTLSEIQGALFSDQGEMSIYVVTELDERDGAKGIKFDSSKVKVLAKQNSKELVASCKSEEEGKLLIKVNGVNKEEDVHITLQGLQLAVDRTVPEGHYYLEAISTDANNECKLLFKEGVIVEVASCGRAPFVTFFLDKKEYITSARRHYRDVTYEIEVSAYKNAEGTIMVPMKYAFNNQIENVTFSGDVIWFTYEEKRIKFNMNTKVAVIERLANKNSDLEHITLGAKPEIKDGRVFLAAEDVAKIEGYGWSVWQDSKEPNAITISGMC